MPIPVTCGSCNKTYQAKDTLAGKRIKCQQCGATIAIPSGSEPAATPAAPAKSAKVEAPAKIAVECGSCGKTFQAGANLAGKRVKCPQCSHPLEVPGGQAAAPPAAKPPAKKPAEAPAAAAPAKPQGGSVNSILDEEFAAGAMPKLAVGGEKYCSKCKAIIPGNAFMCVFCGFDERTGKSITMEGTQVKYVNPADLPKLGYVVASLGLLYGLVGALVNGYYSFICLVILFNKGLPDGVDPEAPLGLFGSPVCVLLTINSMLMLISSVGIMQHRKGSATNAALAGAVFIGFNLFAVAVLGAAMALGANQPSKDPTKADAAPGTFEFLTSDVFVQIVLQLVAASLIPAFVWLWWKFQGRHIDWALPEPEYKKAKPTTGVPTSVSGAAKAQAAVDKVAQTAAKKKVLIPAIIMQVVGWLIVVSGLAQIVLVGIVIYNVMADVGFSQVMENLMQPRPLGQIAGMFIGPAIGFFLTTSGRKMQQLKQYNTVFAATLVMILPCCSLPFAIWSLVVLLQDDVKKSFSD